MGRLTEAKVRTVKPTDRDQWLNDGDGLYLRIRKGGGKVWIIRRKQQGKTQIITLDSHPPLGLKEARLRAAEYQCKEPCQQCHRRRACAEVCRRGGNP